MRWTCMREWGMLPHILNPSVTEQGNFCAHHASVVVSRCVHKNSKEQLLAPSRLSVCLSTWNNNSLWTDFHEIWYFSIFQKYVQKIQVSLKSDKINGYLTGRPIYIFDHISLNSKNENCFKVVEQVKTHILFNTLFQKLCHLWDNVEKYWRAREATDDNMAHAHFTLCTYGYRQTLSEHITLITFLQQKRSHKHTMFHYTYIACLVSINLPLFWWLFQISLLNWIKFQVLYVSMFRLCKTSYVKIRFWGPVNTVFLGP